ncbi:MAG: orotidine-5'-phosphate decarboxylase [Acidimicrobiia bacterium]|nr:orotidine-5'-phosphate decarboxylase [Acidimicrobiia bacterium]MXY75227.1 orotidine-5'-phosphate decarboxylase [Acidimicrobiia bacterium]
MGTFSERLSARMEESGSLLCVGLDPAPDLVFGDETGRVRDALFEWGRQVISQTHRFVCAFKPNLAFYEARGSGGIAALERIMEYLGSEHPGIPVIGDAKRADIGTTSEAYAVFLFDRLGFDAVTLSPWLGRDALRPFLDRRERGCVILCRTSNPGADDLQALEVGGKPLWQRVARMVAEEWNSLGNCLLVIGATRPRDLRTARRLVGDMTFLVPGVGPQGGTLDGVLEAGLNPHGKGLVINSSRGVTTSSDMARAAGQMAAAINTARGNR